MNRKFVFYLFGRIGQTVGLLMMLPTVVALVFGETVPFWSFFGTALLAVALGTLIAFFCKTENNVIYAKEGFAIVALAWLGLSAFGALPFVISKEIPSYIDAFFETVSGFTTTGASILENVEELSHAMLFWRSFTHWIGGMGVLVFVMAIASNITDRSIHIMRAEMPGHVVGKLVPRAKDTAKILYLIYVVMTVVEVVLLICGGMPVFDSLLHSFGTAGTGGFGIKADSLASYNSFCQNVIAVFMLLFGVNFNLYYLLLIGKLRTVFKSTELWAYLCIVAASVTTIAWNISTVYGNVADSFKHSLFQVSSIVTTTGYSTTDFNLWPDLSKGILLMLMFIGACSGSTAGGFKVSRVVILFKLIGREIKHLLHPRAVTSVRFEGKSLDEQTSNSVATYTAIYLLCFITSFLLICHEDFGFETNFTAVVATFNNIGPGFGEVGAAGNFGAYSGFSKLVLSGAMLLGRLEIFPLIIALSPSTWKKTR